MSPQHLTPDQRYEQSVKRQEAAAAYNMRRPNLPPAPAPTTAEMLEFENTHPGTHDGHREEAIRNTFAMSATRYYQYLNQAINTQEALEQDPQLVHRLRARRAQVTAARATYDITATKH